MRFLLSLILFVFIAFACDAEPIKIPLRLTPPPCDFCLTILDMAPRASCGDPVPGYRRTKTTQAQPSGETETYDSEVIYRYKTDDFNDVISVNCTPPTTASRVYKAQRTLSYHFKSPEIASVKAALVKRYGKPYSDGIRAGLPVMEFARDSSGKALFSDDITDGKKDTLRTFGISSYVRVVITPCSERLAHRVCKMTTTMTDLALFDLAFAEAAKFREELQKDWDKPLAVPKL